MDNFSTDSCTLCGLPSKKSVPKDENGNVFCCRGCRKIHRLLQNHDITQDEVKNWVKDRREEENTSKPREPVDGETVFYRLGGMHCSTCEIFIEKMVQRMDGVLDTHVNYTTEMASIRYDPEAIDEEKIQKTIKKLGYRPHPPGSISWEDTGQGNRILFAIAFGMMIMAIYLFSHYPAYLKGSQISPGGEGYTSLLITNYGLWFLTTPVVFYSGYPFLRGAYVSLRARTPNMDALVGLAILSAYTYSAYATLTGRVEVYFDVATILVVVIGIGKSIELRLKRYASKSIQDIVERDTDQANLVTENGLQNIQIDDIQKGQTLLVKNGEEIPVDGRIVKGSTTVDEAIMTGEPRPVTKHLGNHVMGGTVNLEAPVKIEALAPGTESTINRLIRRLWGVQSSTTSTQRTVDQLSTYFIPGVILLATITFLWHSQSGLKTGVLVGISVLVASCPCAFGLATPLALASGIKSAVTNGILVMNVEGFEKAHDVDAFVLDKTRTLTQGGFQVKKIVTNEAETREILAKAASVEEYSNHPLAHPILEKASEIGIDTPEVQNYEATPGMGISGDVEDVKVHVGSLEYMETLDVKNTYTETVKKHRENGSIPILTAWNGEVKGTIIIQDVTRKDAEKLVSDLKRRELEVVLSTGDSEVPANRLAKELGIDKVYSNVSPDKKTEVVNDLQKKGKKVGMVGDGTNDSLALATADLGIAMGTSATLATDSADIVLLKNQLSGITSTLNISRQTGKRIRQNLGWALTYNMVAIPSAVLGLLDPLLAAVAMVCSSIIVILNSIRLSTELKSQNPVVRNDL